VNILVFSVTQLKLWQKFIADLQEAGFWTSTLEDENYDKVDIC
jgi:hypothetical protein